MSRGRDLEQILTQYTTFVKPAFEEFCLPVPTFCSLGNASVPSLNDTWHPSCGSRLWVIVL